MNSMTVCLAVGAISFVRCEFSFQPPFHNPQNNHIYTEERVAPDTSDDTIPAAFEGPPHIRNHPLKDFHHLARIFHECKTKVSKRLKQLIKSKVNSRLSELKAYVWSFYQCVKVYGFRALDEVLEEDFVPISEYAYFVRDGVNETGEFSSGRANREGPPGALKEYAARVLPQEWTALLYNRIDSFLRSHSLKFNFDKSITPQDRSRRRDHRMFAMMVMGFMIMASILIPMGFQFLTVLGGKSLLLAKMALIMSAINGLKKIATSNVGYGFYHTPPDGHHHEHLHHGFHEKQLHLNPHNYNHLQPYN